MPIRVYLRNLTIIMLGILVLGPGMILPQKLEERARKYTRPLEFDYFNWTVGTFWDKLTQEKRTEIRKYKQKELVYTYLRLVGDVQNLNNQIANQYSDPQNTDPANSTKQLSETLDAELDRMNSLASDVETILQQQVSSILFKEKLTVFSLILPPVLYHSTDVPLSLLISPRDHIQLDANISLLPGLSTSQQVALEKEVESGLNVSALVEPIGGLGTYPTMIMMTADLNWLVETIAHEWIHNYLTLFPLGQNYDTSPELRTMNETTANLAGKEIGTEVIRTYYPESIHTVPAVSLSTPRTESVPVNFDFQKEMRITRENTDRLLSQGKITEAETYMENRRHIFWNNGYLIRRINQAYFAFYGAYNDSPGGGAAGTDPVGPAVVTFREMHSSLADFLEAISRMDSYNQLQIALKSSVIH